MKPIPAVLAETAFDRIGCELIAGALRAADGPLVIRAGGSSMVPAIWPGDTIEIHAPGGARMAAGQVAVFSRDDRLFAHRIIAIEERAGVAQFITRGDALAASDPPVACAEILGYVGAVIRDGRRIPIACRAPGRRARMLAFTIRNSGLMRRLILRLHARRRGRIGSSVDSRVNKNECPA